MSKKKKRNPYPDRVRKEAVRAYFAGKSSIDAASIACMKTGWKGDTPDPSSVRGWAAKAKAGAHAAEKKMHYPKGLQRDVVTAYKAGATIEDAIEAACDEWQWGSNYPDSVVAETWIKEAGVSIRAENYPDNLRLETLNCYWANKNASLAARQACELTGWTGEVPSFRIVTGWIWEAEQVLANAKKKTADDSLQDDSPQEDVDRVGERRATKSRAAKNRATKNRATKGKDPILDWVLNMGGSPQDAAAIAAWRGPSEPQVRVVDSLEAAVELVAKQASDGEAQASDRADEFASAMTGHMLDALDVNGPKKRVRRTRKQILDTMEKRLESLRDRKRIADLMGAAHEGRVADENKKEYRKLVKHLRAMIVAQSAFGADSLESEAKSAFEMREKICAKLEALLKGSATSMRESSGSVYIYPEKFRQEVVKKYESGASSTVAVDLVRSQTEWSDIRIPDKNTVLRWVRSAGVHIRSGRRGLFGKELTSYNSDVSGKTGVYVYPEQFRDEVVKEYESGAGAVKAAGLVGGRAKWASVRDPDRATVLRWVRAAGVKVRSSGGSDGKYSDAFKEEAIKAYVDGASAAAAAELARERSGWTGKMPSHTALLGWVRESGNNVRGNLYPDSFKEEAVKAYVSGSSAYWSVSLAIQRTGWTGKRPSNTAMLGWVRESGNKVRNRGETK